MLESVPLLWPINALCEALGGIFRRLVSDKRSVTDGHPPCNQVENSHDLSYDARLPQIPPSDCHFSSFHLLCPRDGECQTDQ